MKTQLTIRPRGEHGGLAAVADTSGPSSLLPLAFPYTCSNRQIVDHPEGGTAYADCGLCPGCENTERLEQQALELWEAA